MNEFSAEFVELETLVPLWGLDVGGSVHELDSGVSIREFTDDELSRALSVGVITSFHSSIGIYTTDSQKIAAFVLSHKVPKIIGEPTPERPTAQRVWSEQAQAVETLEQCLALAGLGETVRPSGWLQIRNDLGGGTGTSFSQGARRRFAPVETSLSAEVASLLKSYWAILGDNRFRANRALSLALRRLSYADDRERPEDAILDLLIACEAFFLEGSDQELGYKLSIRAALWNEMPDWDRRDVFTLLTNAYRVRSAIAHGNEPKVKHVSIRGELVPLQQFASTVGELLRGSLAKAVNIAASSDDYQLHIDWDSLTLGVSPPGVG
jgi:hypothetical protein